MQGHLPGPPHPHIPNGPAPLIGYVATREPRPLDDRPPAEPGGPKRAAIPPLDVFDDVGAWEPMHRPLFKVMAVVIAISLVIGGVSTVLEVLLNAR